MVTRPATVGRLFNIQPEYRLEWTPDKRQGRGPTRCGSGAAILFGNS